jgi:Phage tail sheath protein subtilisin-like domain
MPNLYTNMAPGVYMSERDLTTRARIQTTTMGAMVFASKRGPIDKPRFIKSGEQFINEYGKADPSFSPAHDCALAFLAESQLYAVRPKATGSLYGGNSYCLDFASRNTLNLSTTADPFVSDFGARIVAVPFFGSTTAYDQGAPNVSLVSFYGTTLVTLNSMTLTITDGTTTVTTVPVVFNNSHDNTLRLFTAAINTALATIPAWAGSQAYLLDEEVNSVTKHVIAVRHGPQATLVCGVYTAVPASAWEVSALGQAVGRPLVGKYSVPITGGVVGTKAVCVNSSKVFDVFAENPGVWANQLGTRISGVEQEIKQRVKLTMSGPLVTGNVINMAVNNINQPPITFAVSSDSTMNAIAASLVANNPSIQSATVTLVAGPVDNNREIVIVARYGGANALVIDAPVITLGATQPTIAVSESLTPISATNEFDLQLYDRSNVNLPIERYRVSLKKQVNSFGRQTAIDTVVNLTGNTSANIRVNIIESMRPFIFKSTLSGSSYVVDSFVRWFGGGADGSAITNSQIVTGWDAFKNREKVPVRILINGGYTDVSVHQKMVAIAEYRQDSFAVLDMPSTAQATQAAWNYRMLDLNINSSYGAIYTPDLLIQDDESNDRRYVPPSGKVAADYAYSDKNYAIWQAPAGHKRGRLQQVQGMRVDYEQGDRELLNTAGINCLIDKIGSGPVIWGAETLQYQKSILSTVSARRFLNFLKIAYADGLDYNVFDPNNDQTRFEIVQMGRNLCQPFKDAGGLIDFEIVCDEGNNPPSLMDEEAVSVRMYLKITPTAKRILLEAVLLKTGASFSEQIALDATGQR